MRIVMFSMTPLFADKAMGGAQKQLKKVALYLAEQGHDVTILCTRRDGVREAFQWHDNCRIIPSYDFKQPFPEPYAVPPYAIAAALDTTHHHLSRADVFYSHDGGLIFPYVYQHIPAVISLRSVIFSETIQSGFLFQGDALILPSQHTAAVWKHTVGRFFPGYADRIHVIHNGLDFDVYRPTESGNLAARLGVDPARHAIILYPHRPEPPKGIRQTLDLADRLVNQFRMAHLRVLMPRWFDAGVEPGLRAFYSELQGEIHERGLNEHIIFHDWIGEGDMPAYYSLGHLTVALGDYVETFGNTPYESLACGTPILAARVGPYRDMLPETLLVDYGDTDAAAEGAAIILREKQPVPPDINDWLRADFQQADMVRAYADIITNATKKPALSYAPPPTDETTVFSLAPWCMRRNRQIYNDFAGDWSEQDDLCQLLDKYDQRVPLAAVHAQEKSLLNWEHSGYLVRIEANNNG